MMIKLVYLATVSVAAMIAEFLRSGPAGTARAAGCGRDE